MHLIFSHKFIHSIAPGTLLIVSDFFTPDTYEEFKNMIEIEKFDCLLEKDQTEAVMKLHQEGKTMEAMVEVLIMRALDEEGAPLFKSADKFELMNGVDPIVITEVAGYILSFEPEQEDIAKN